MDNELGAKDPYNGMNTGKDEIEPDFLKKKDGGGFGEGAKAAAGDIASAVMAAKGGGGGAAAKGGSAAAKGGEAAAAKGGSAAAKGGEAAGKGNLAGGGGNSTDKAKAGTKEAKKGLTGEAEAREKEAGGLYKGGKGGDGDGDDASLFKKKEKSTLGSMSAIAIAAPFFILLLSIAGIVALVVALPIMMIGAIDSNLIRILGFENTIAIIEKVGGFVTSHFLSEGQMPSEYSMALAQHGVDVGQVLANGEFVKTDVYIADIENRNDLVAAASGFSYISEDEGELAMLYKGRVIRADEFVAELNSDPTLYAAYSEAADLSTKYYYSDEVEDVYEKMNLSRGNFNEWKSTGNYVKDEESYNEILTEMLNDGSSLKVGGFCYEDDEPEENDTNEVDKSMFVEGGTYEKKYDDSSPEDIAQTVAENTREYVINWDSEEGLVGGVLKNFWKPKDMSEDSTKRASELLNTALSSSEPYLASSAFIALEEPIGRAKVDGDGPVNQVMNTLTRGKEVTYQNVQSGEDETTDLAILETSNFRAAVSDSKYDANEAQNFGRDRILATTGQEDMRATIRTTTVTSKGQVKSGSVVRNGKLSSHADVDTVTKAVKNIDLSTAEKNSETFQSVIGGNRILEGGAFLSNTINEKVIGGLPSDSGSMTAYYQEVKEAMDRRHEAERATKSPFDISSPYTFFGSIVHNIATSVLKNYGTGLTALSAVTSAGDTAGKAVANLMGAATAYSPDDEFVTMDGIGCKTAEAVSVNGDLYCSTHTTLTTDYLEYSMSDWENALGDQLEGGHIKRESELGEFTLINAERYSSVGTKNTQVCEIYRELNKDKQDATGKSIWAGIKDFFSTIGGVYESCDESIVPREISTGAAYTSGSEAGDRTKMYSGFVMYDEVRSLLSNEKSKVAVLREEWAVDHPVDNSEAGMIARRSGMTKHEAEIALAYADYLTMIARYDPSDRYAFAAPVVTIEHPILEEHNNKVMEDLYAWYQKETEYDDLRNRQGMTA